MNVFTFSGNLGRDGEVRYSQSGTPMLSFSVAVKSGWGERQKTHWVRCTLFGKRAEGGLKDHLKKGQQVVVSGELAVSEYEKDGQTRTSLECKANEVTLVGGQSHQPPAAAADPMDMEIPF